MSTATPAMAPLVGVGGELHVVGWPEAAIGHLHHPRLGVRGRGPRLLLRFSFSGFGGSGFASSAGRVCDFPDARSSRVAPGPVAAPARFARDRQRFLDPPLAIIRRPLSRRRLSPASRAGIAARVLREAGAPACCRFLLAVLQASECRRNEAAPAAARTRTPSCATRSKLARPIFSNP